MTQAREFVEAWHQQTKTIGAENLARQIASDVKVTKTKNPLMCEYYFPDGSLAKTEGKGRSFKIWCYA